MKQFSHPDQREKIQSDINKMLGDMLTVARNEYKYVAKVSTDFGEPPSVLCHPGELGQVFLNLVVNAAHAIGDIVGDSAERGTIQIRTFADGANAVVQIADSGGGIPEEIQHRVFDQFFTTKAVGKGTGQGLAMSRRIVEKHGGAISFESTRGKGTIFTVCLPVEGGKAESPEGAAA